MRLTKFSAIIIVLFLSVKIGFTQGGYADLLMKEVEVENPVYMPVLGIGTGFINYFGELQNDYTNLIQGSPTYRINLYQYIDSKHYLKANVNALLGKVSGYERNFSDTSKNLNFQTDLFGFGLNIEYSFGNIYKSKKKIVPFISLGGEYFQDYKSKTDLGRDGQRYVYYPDGTIRIDDRIVSRDYKYETNIADWDPFGRKLDKTSFFTLVVDLGFDFKITDRVALRLASSLHYAFTDDLDGVSYKNTTGRIGDKTNDMFSYTYVSLNFDLFSDPKTKMIEALFLDVSGDFDLDAYSDKDNDGILDFNDDCLGTPKDVAVDSVGCPLDDDKDGVPNYIDKEQFTVKGTIVDEYGAELSPNKIRDLILQDLDAVNRKDQYMIPVGINWTEYTGMTEGYIPEKFKKLDKDGDSYISFDELLEAINGFFDQDSEFTSDDIYELNSFFFAQ